MTAEPRHPLVIALIKARVDADLTQADIATRLGVAGSTICAWETGVRRVHLDTTAAWADAVGLRLALMRETPR